MWNPFKNWFGGRTQESQMADGTLGLSSQSAAPSPTPELARPVAPAPPVQPAPDPPVSRVSTEPAASALSKRSPEQPSVSGDVIALLHHLKSQDEVARRAALLSLGQARLKEAAPQILAVLTDPDSDLRDSAAYAAGCLKIREAYPHLVKMLKEPDSAACRNAVIALGELQEPAAAGPLISLFERNDPDIAELITGSLLSCGPPAIARLREASESGPAAVRWYSQKALEVLESRAE